MTLPTRASLCVPLFFLASNAFAQQQTGAPGTPSPSYRGASGGGGGGAGGGGGGGSQSFVAPEMDPELWISGLILVVGGLLILTGWRRSRAISQSVAE